MRYINTLGYNPKGWQKKADIHLMALRRCTTSKQRKDYLNTGANKHWNDHKKAFERLSHYKCWFSEAYASVSDYAIEHFRPKNGVDLIKSKDNYKEQRTVTDLDGYWWLAYELKNLRLAAQKPNQLKGNYFPLEAGSLIATSCNNSWLREKCMLLDPCVKEDTQLLTYDGTKPMEANPNSTSIEHIRARISIKVYGLERLQRLKNARSVELQHAKNYYNQALINWNAMNLHRGLNVGAYDLAKRNFSNNCGFLVFMLRPDKQFTKMILAFLKGLNKDWINDFVIDVAQKKGFL